MNKVLLGLLAVATVALLVWALMPAGESPVGAPTVAPPTTAEAATGGDEADGPEGAAGAAVGTAPRAATPAPARPKAAPATPRPAPKLELPKLAAPLMPLPEGEVRPPDQARYGRSPDSPMPRVDPVEFKNTVRQYYGNLPRSGRMPARITVEELFPRAVYEGLNVPPGSQVVEIGHYPATGPEGLAEALEIPDDQMSTFGVTVVTPDGQRVRDYVRLSTEDDETAP